MKAIYINNEGAVSIVYPTITALQQYKIEEIAVRSIPLNTPFWIVSEDDIQTDRETRNEWDIDIEQLGEPSGYGGQE